jgi:Ca-activated chloride channel family protein
MFEFEYPYIFLLLILFVVCELKCKAKLTSYYMPHLKILSSSTQNSMLFTSLMKWLAIFLAIIALASPVKKLNIINKKSDGVDIVLSLDTSGSMAHRGFNPRNPMQNRWDAVSQIVKKFIGKRLNDNIALVVFGRSVMTASALSYDKEAQQNIIDRLQIGIVGQETALIDSVAGSINILKNSDAKSKIVILLTDGEDTASQIPLKVVSKLAKKHGIKIYAIGIGEYSKFTLNELASSTEGKMFGANSTDDLKLIYEAIDALEKSEIKQNKIVLKEYFFFYPLFLSIVLFIGYMLLRNRV